MHARKAARDAYFPRREDDLFFDRARGDVVFQDSAGARRFAHAVNEKDGESGTRARDEKEAAELERDFGVYGGSDIRRWQAHEDLGFRGHSLDSE